MDEELAECLLMWVQTFSVSGERDSVNALCDGAALSQILNQVSPSFFGEDWLAGIKADQASNKHIKISNLKKILRAVISFYEDEVGMAVQETKKPNLKMVVESNNLLEMGRLLQLVLGCAVNCENKQDYIQNIMSMEESVQHGVMTAIQELMTQETPLSPGVGEGGDLASQLLNTQRELAETKQANSDLSHRCTELDLQVASLLEEKSQLENHHDDSIADKGPDDLDDPNTAAGKKYLDLQQRLEQYKDEVYRLDAAKEDYRVKYDYCSRELSELTEKMESLTALGEEARSLKDEVDVLRQNEEKVKIYESTIESYKRKLEDMTDLKRSVKLLEEKNTSYMEKSVEWEEESKKTSALKSQVEVYKRQVQELQSKLNTETKRGDKSDFEMKRLQDKMAGTQKENARLAQEIQSMKENNEELEYAKLQGLSTENSQANSLSLGGVTSTNSIFNELYEAGGGGPNTASDSDDDLELLSLPPALKEKYVRLQTENRMLNKKLSDSGDTAAIQSMLDDAQSRVNELETDGRISNQRVMELEAQVQDLQEASQKIPGEGDASKELKKRLAELTQKVRTLESEVAKKRQHIETADSRIGEFTQLVKEKDDKLQQRENEMKEMEEKYKKYLEKAKSVIAKMETPTSTDPSMSPQLEALRGQLLEKERLVAQIQQDSDRQKSIREREEKLMVSAWYNMGMTMHRKAVEDRLNQYTTGQSFLARQRQVHSKRAGVPLTPTNK
ncbi:protein Hook homolog 3-like isoform X2 [Watersipora subatra]|uniref:protein Hook homolog 3-like isoform X2 n=1 Tax=Watersipora subatra TaxID=2589382 RepID=UPI00355BA6B3